MTRYHISSNGKPGVCHARVGGCPLGGENQHFSSPEDANKFIQKRLENSYNVYFSVPGAKGKVAEIDRINTDNKNYAASTRNLALGIDKNDSEAVTSNNKGGVLGLKHEIKKKLREKKYSMLRVKTNRTQKFEKFDNLEPQEQYEYYDAISTNLQNLNMKYDSIQQQINHLTENGQRVDRETLKQQKYLKKQIAKLEGVTQYVEEKSPNVQAALYDSLSYQLNTLSKRPNGNGVNDNNYEMFAIRRKMSRIEFNAPGIAKTTNRRLFNSENNMAASNIDKVTTGQYHQPVGFGSQVQLNVDMEQVNHYDQIYNRRNNTTIPPKPANWSLHGNSGGTQQWAYSKKGGQSGDSIGIVARPDSPFQNRNSSASYW